EPPRPDESHALPPRLDLVGSVLRRGRRPAAGGQSLRRRARAHEPEPGSADELLLRPAEAGDLDPAGNRADGLLPELPAAHGLSLSGRHAADLRRLQYPEAALSLRLLQGLPADPSGGAHSAARARARM